MKIIHIKHIKKKISMCDIPLHEVEAVVPFTWVHFALPPGYVWCRACRALMERYERREATILSLLLIITLSVLSFIAGWATRVWWTAPVALPTPTSWYF